MSSQQNEMDWQKALTAGAVATVAITVVGMILGMDMMRMLGEGMVGEDGGAMIYVLGGLIHLMIGLVYGVVFATIAPKVPLPSVASGLIFGVILTPIAMKASPVMMGMMPHAPAAGSNPCGGGSNPCANPCNPCADNPCNPCAKGNPCNPCGDNPCNPCADNPCGDNPCNPCGDESALVDNGWTLTGFQENPCGEANPCGGSNPCGGTNPCGGDGSGINPWVGSFINHMIFGLVLGLMYKPKGS